MTQWIILGIIGLLVAFVIFKSIVIVRPDEMGVKVFLGKPTKEVDSGPKLVLWPIITIVKYPKEVMKFTYKVKTIMTKKGIVKGTDESVVEPAVINITCTVYAQFQKGKLLQTIQHAPGNDAQSLGPVIGPYIMDAVRALGGRLPWRLINQERHKFARWILARLIPVGDESYYEVEEIVKGKELVIGFKDQKEYPNTLDENALADSPFVKFGLGGVAFAIEDIDFEDEELAKSVNAPEKARLAAIATKLKAEATEYQKIHEGRGDAKAREAMIKVIKDNPELEVLYALREMAQGTSNTILYQIPAAFENRIRDMLGGNSLGEVFRLLSPEDKVVVRDAIQQAIERLGKGGVRNE